MKLKDFSDLIVFDEFPTRYNSQQKIVLTHLLNLEKQVLPESLCTIITTTHLARQFKEYCKQKGSKCLNTAVFECVEPYNYKDIRLEGCHTVQMLFCESKEVTRNLMVLIREDGKLKCIYSGNFLDIRTALFNDTFASWIERDNVPQLYLNLKRCHENPHKQHVDQIFKIYDDVEQILNCHSNGIIHMYLPLFGYDNFISKLTGRFRKRVTITNDFKLHLNPYLEKETLPFLCDTIEKSQILLFAGSPRTLSGTVCPYTKRKQVTVQIQEIYKDNENIEVSSMLSFYTLYYTPEPSPFHLQLLCMLLKPKRLYGIIDSFNINSKVPSYLNELCGNTTPADRDKRRSRFTQSLRSISDAKVVQFGPHAKNPTQRRELYEDDSESD